MVKTDPKSRIEVWRGEYINNSPSSTGTTIRTDEDKNVDILQIEPGNSPDDYIVEIVEKKEDGEKCADTSNARDLELCNCMEEGFKRAMAEVVNTLNRLNDDPNFEYSHMPCMRLIKIELSKSLDNKLKTMLGEFEQALNNMIQ